MVVQKLGEDRNPNREIREIQLYRCPDCRNKFKVPDRRMLPRNSETVNDPARITK
jgi:hypothetical protein